MTKLILESGTDWTKKKIKDAIHTEMDILNRAIERIQHKLSDFERKHGKFDRESLYGTVDDMELLEWEGEMESLSKLKEFYYKLVRVN